MECVVKSIIPVKSIFWLEEALKPYEGLKIVNPEGVWRAKTTNIT